MPDSTYYPPRHEKVPEGLTAPSAQFRSCTLLLLLSLAAFFAFYFGVMLFCLLYIWWAIWICPQQSESLYLRILALIGIGPAFLQFLFFARNLVGLDHAHPAARLEIFAADQPRLFDFLRRLCDETYCGMPRHVYVDHTVNAAALLDVSSNFHLVLPGRPSLSIGLGLVNTLNLSEFKAIIAHELGHFAHLNKVQNLVQVARRIAARVILRDDLAAWSRKDWRIAWPAWIVLAIVWAPRQVVALLWQAIVLFDRALNRQQELHADLIAVSVAGSEVTARAFRQCEIGAACFKQAAAELKSAVDNPLATGDLFDLQSAALESAGEQPVPTANPASDESWACHPSLEERVRNIQKRLVTSDVDARSAWLLFDHPQELRERVTADFCRRHAKKPAANQRVDPAQVQQIIDA